MEKNKRKKVGVDDSTEDEKPSSKISFDAFFLKRVREGKLKPWHRMEIAAFFFQDMKLTEEEDSEVYEATLEKY